MPRFSAPTFFFFWWRWNHGYPRADVLPLALPRGGEGLWRSGVGSDPSAAAAASSGAGAQWLCSCVLPLRAACVLVSWVMQAPCWCPLPGSSGLEARLCWDWAPQQQPSSPSPPAFFWPAPAPRSPPSMWVSLTLARCHPSVGRAEVLLTRVPHMWALHSVPEPGFRIPLGTQSVVGRMDEALVSGHVHPTLQLSGWCGGGDPGPTYPAHFSPVSHRFAVPAPGATNSSVNALEETRVAELLLTSPG